jgi:hypothetical protein
MGSCSETDGEELVGGLECAMEVRGHGQAHHVRLTLGYCLCGLDRQSTLSGRVSGVIGPFG